MCLNFFVGHISKRDCREGKRTTVDYIVYYYICRFKLSTCGWSVNEYFLGWRPIFSAHFVGKKYVFFFSIFINIVHVQDNFKRFSLKKLRNNINWHNWILHVFFIYLSNFLKNLTIFRIKQMESFLRSHIQVEPECDFATPCVTYVTIVLHSVFV